MAPSVRTLLAATSATASQATLAATVRPTSTTASPVSRYPSLFLALGFLFLVFSMLHTTIVCRSDPCSNGGICEDGIDTFTCTCLPGFRGPRCEEDINECESNPCKNGANCTDCVNSYTCTCLPGFSGIHCETNTQDCTER